MARILLGTPVALANLDLLDVGMARGWHGLRPGYHHLWVKTATRDERYQGEVLLKNEEAACVLRVDPLRGLVADESIAGWASVDEAVGGALDEKLVDPFAARRQHAYDWHTATWMIDRPVFQIPLGDGAVTLRSGEARQLQAAFVRKVLRHDEPGGARFLELVRGFASVEPSRIGGATELYLDVAESLTAMLALAPALFGAEQARADDWILALSVLLDRAGRQHHEPLVPAAAALHEAWRGARA